MTTRDQAEQVIRDIASRTCPIGDLDPTHREAWIDGWVHAFLHAVQTNEAARDNGKVVGALEAIALYGKLHGESHDFGLELMARLAPREDTTS